MILGWPACSRGAGSGCTGARVGQRDACWAHLNAAELEVALDRLSPGDSLDLRGTVVDPGLLLSILDRMRTSEAGQARIGSALCEHASFPAGALFGATIFLQNAEFSEVSFGQGACFEAARFEGSADFSAAGFARELPVPGGTPDRRTSFDRAEFCREARFKAAVFGGLATFTGTKFDGPAQFGDAQFDVVKFGGTRFGGGSSFENATVMTELMLESVRIAGGLNLDGMRAAGQVDVRADVAEVSCKNGTFGGQLTLRLAGSRLCLEGTVFGRSARVESWLRSAHAAPGSGAEVEDKPVSLCSLRGVDAEHLTLANADLGRCLIYGLRRPEQLRLAGRISFAPTPRDWHLRWGWLPWRWTNRNALYEEHLWRQQNGAPAAKWTVSDPDGKAPETVPVPGPALLAVLYRQLRQAVEAARNEPGAADLYYGEMEMRRLSTERWDERLLLTLYWLVSGYGLRASRSLLLLAALVLLAALGMQRVGFPGKVPGYADCLLYAAGSVLSLDLAGHLRAVLTDWGQLIRMILRVCGPLLLGLGALAVRGRIKR